MVWGRLGRARLVVEVVQDFVCDEEAMLSFSVLYVSDCPFNESDVFYL